jgi:hypothetical protein
MPYIKEGRQHLRPTSDWKAESPGDLNFQITSLVVDYIDRCGESYHTYNEVIGVLECAKQELYRRMVAPYEIKKHAENGDVYVLGR